MKIDIENAKQDIQMKTGKGHVYSSQEGEHLEIQVAEQKAEKGVTTLQVSVKVTRILSNGSRIYNYLCNQCLSPIKL